MTASTYRAIDRKRNRWQGLARAPEYIGGMIFGIAVSNYGWTGFWIGAAIGLACSLLASELLDAWARRFFGSERDR